MESLLVIGIRREAIRLFGIRQEPLERWIKDGDGRNIPELALNSLLMAEAFLQLHATGLGALILTSATAVLLGGFSTKIKKEDFWYITAISIIQTAKYVIPLILMLSACQPSVVLSPSGGSAAGARWS